MVGGPAGAVGVSTGISGLSFAEQGRVPSERSLALTLLSSVCSSGTKHASTARPAR